MTVPRRGFLAGASAAILSACVPAGRMAPGGAGAEFRPAPNAAYDAWIASFRTRAEARGIPPRVVGAAFRGAGYLPGVVERDRNQAEFRRTLEDYLAILAPDDKVARGRARLAANRGLLDRIEDRYGVPAPVVAAIWGVESNYGARRGDIPVVSATSTLAFEGRRGRFFENQLMAALRILADGDVPPARMTGSWAGAMGHTQFIPTTFRAYAVDFDGDGRRDIWSENPTDALASAAAYLSRSGWRRGESWGQEVTIPDGYQGPSGRGDRRPGSAWAADGIRAARGGGLPGGDAALLLPAGPTGPAFLAYRNFDVILRYNSSVNYGIGVGYLSDRLSGELPLRGRFPPDRYGLTIEDRRALQRRLTAAGHDTGGDDGVIGPRTTQAIRDFQRANGLPVTGVPSRALLDRLI